MRINGDIGVISDTHGQVRPEALSALADCEPILHVGDIGKPEVMDALSEQAQALEKLGQLAANESPCVMCYERDPKQCHRMLIAERLASMAGVEVEHLFVG